MLVFLAVKNKYQFLKPVIPFVLASLLLGLLIAMVFIKPISPSRAVFSQPEENREGYFFLPVGAENTSGISAEDYRKILSRFHLKYFMQVYGLTTKPLSIPVLWENPYFGAFAELRDHGAAVNLWGGMARAPGATPVVLATILCHEIGHLLGGEPKQTIEGSSWASVEGQADYYAAAVCLPEFFRDYAGPQNFEESVLKVCDGERSCAQVAQAGLEFMRFVQRYSYRDFVPVRVEASAPESQILVRNSYPSDQCRLDTFIQAAKCNYCRPPKCWLGQ